MKALAAYYVVFLHVPIKKAPIEECLGINSIVLNDLDVSYRNKNDLQCDESEKSNH